MEKTNKITLSEFRAWLDGLLAGRDMEREALPTSDQWKKILGKIDSIFDYDGPGVITEEFQEGGGFEYKPLFGARAEMKEDGAAIESIHITECDHDWAYSVNQDGFECGKCGLRAHRTWSGRLGRKE